MLMLLLNCKIDNERSDCLEALLRSVETSNDAAFVSRERHQWSCEEGV